MPAPVILRATAHLSIPPEAAWNLYCDLARATQWQLGLKAVRDVSGDPATVGSTWVLDHGPKMERRVIVRVAERPVRHVVEQAGMGVHDTTTATFEPDGDGTRLTMVSVGRLNALMGFFARLGPGRLRRAA